jgi:hypothetical protein
MSHDPRLQGAELDATSVIIESHTELERIHELQGVPAR